jgi:deazaflavin-dependent oxidoreductase (nitroreductase family)
MTGTGQRDRGLRERAMTAFAASRPGGWLFVNVFNRIDPLLLRVTGGRLSVAVGSPVLLLTSTGARSGQRRQTPLLYATDGNRIVLVASKAGSPRHPAWYHNVMAHPRVEVLAPRRSGRYRAREAQGEERERLWRQVNELYSGYDTYQGRAGERRIPVVVLEPDERS